MNKTMSLKEVSALTFESFLPFMLLLQTDGAADQAADQQWLYADKLIRLLPGRRIVVKGRWNKQTVIAKIYYHPFKGWRDSVREKKGVKRLLQAQVLTPNLLYSGRVASQFGYALIFSYIENTDTQQSFNFPHKPSVFFTQVMQIFAQLHRAGFIQADCHSDNFLHTGEATYAIDASEIKKVNHNAKTCYINNLATFFALYPAEIDRWIKSLLEHYTEIYPNLIDESDEVALFQNIKLQRQQARIRYAHKMERACSEIIYTCTWQHMTLLRREFASLAIEQIWKNPQQYFLNTQAKLLSQHVVQTTLAGFNVIIKRYPPRYTYQHGFGTVLKPSAARLAWFNAHLIKDRVASNKPMALCEQRFGPLIGYSYMIMTYLPGVTLSQYLLSANDLAKQKILTEIHTLLDQLYAGQWVHGQLTAEHIIVDQDKPYLVDLTLMRTVTDPVLFKDAFKQDIYCFLASLPKEADITKMFDGLAQGYI